MKKLIVSILLLSLLLALFAGCGQESHDLLYSVEHDGTTYCVRGTDTQAKQLVVKKGDEVLWSKSISVSEKVGARDGSYGFSADDLNFDGYRDLAIPTDVSGECSTYVCYLYNAQKKTYVYSEELSALYNVKSDATLKAVFGFSQTSTYEPAYQDVPAGVITSDIATMYTWEKGVLTPNMRVSITHYPETSNYLYSVAYYDAETKSFSEDYGKEHWISEEKYKDADLSVIYYYK